MADNMYDADIITLVDDDGVQHEFEILDAIETDDGRYCALLPYYGDDSDAADDSEYYILQVVEVDGSEELTEIEDSEMLDTLAEIFEDRFAQRFADE